MGFWRNASGFLGVGLLLLVVVALATFPFANIAPPAIQAANTWVMSHLWWFVAMFVLAVLAFAAAD